MFFFFKQKTADDVRISDWSSDVCSSDLNHQLGVDDHGDPAGPDVRQLHQSCRGLWYCRYRCHVHRYLPARGGALQLVEMEQAAGDGEIGRASCRERVCQYV